GVVCVSGNKARGVTGIGTPMGDPYDIDYVSHEMGHQFGANHTQNNPCNRNNSTAVEPGSASTIMGYAGICLPDVQNNSDDHFHSVSITEMWNKIQTSASCAVTISTGNSAPVIVESEDYSIPKSTPFILRGNASDVNSNNVLSYNWEQTDTEVASMPPASTSTSGPAFRSNSSISSPNRYMPALPTVIAGSTSSTWEVVPSVAREMNFSLVVRDNATGGGNSARDDMKVTTVDITPFTVDGPSTNEEWLVGSNQTLNWVVGATDQAPVNTQNVTILLSTDGGVTFPITLAANTPNDGSEAFVVPNNTTSSARIMIAAVDNIFYNVNSTNFTISEATASIKDVSFEGFNLYPNPSNGNFNLQFETISTALVKLQLFDLTGRLVREVQFSNVAARFSESISFKNTAKGLYLLKIKNGSKQTTRKLVIE
ncbi:MAG: T9SS type A sorting domain-containing protein, partial [Flavobacterium sp.]|nr:T9SS type A sorting domain-containing protein [Flavobacterium sp.]